MDLAQALRYATDICIGLRVLHEAGRVHGSVNAKSIVVEAEGATLIPPNTQSRSSIPATDVSAFGALLYEMVTGEKPSARIMPPLPSVSATAEGGIRVAATRLASRCLGSVSDSPAEMQKVLAEVRILSSQAKLLTKDLAFASPNRLSKPAPVSPAPAPPPVAEVTATLPARKDRSGEQSFTMVPAKGFLSTAASGAGEPGPSGVKCPKCGVPYVYPSRPRSWFETLCSSWKAPPMRCHRCLHRFITVFGRFHFEKGSPNSAKGAPV